MKIQIRNARPDEYDIVEGIMKQVHQMHIDWRPDIYQPCETVLPADLYEQAVRECTVFVAEYEGTAAGILLIVYRRAEHPIQVPRNIIFIDSMAVDENYRGKGIGHAFFDFLKQLKDEKGCDGIELQVNARNKAAYAMYSSYGFTDKSINMELL